MASDLMTILNDAAWDEYITNQQYEEQYDKEMQIATLQQCIYLLVEGDTEAQTYPELLGRCDLDLKDLGVVIGNYGGAPNLIHTLRLLKKTLSHDRPVIATIDNDEDGARICKKLSTAGFPRNLITLVPMPSIITPIEYPSGHKGGSFEEMFSAASFIEQTFSPDFMPAHIVKSKAKFRKQFKENKSWFTQVKKFCSDNDYKGIENHKVKIGIRLTKTSKKVLPDIKKLAEIVLEVREKHPVLHLAEIVMQPDKGKKRKKKGWKEIFATS